MKGPFLTDAVLGAASELGKFAGENKFYQAIEKIFLAIFFGSIIFIFSYGFACGAAERIVALVKHQTVAQVQYDCREREEAQKSLSNEQRFRSRFTEIMKTGYPATFRKSRWSN